MKKHKVIAHYWNQGELQTFEYLFDEFDEAHDYASNTDAHAIKIFNVAGELVHSIESEDSNTGQV